MTGTRTISREIDQRLAALGRSGIPLPAPLLSAMNRLFQADFSAVRVHVGDEPARLGVLAFAHGEHIFLAPDAYRPDETWSREIIAHELAHVLQQRRGLGARDGAALEIEAIRAGRAVHGGDRPVLDHQGDVAATRAGHGRLIQTYTLVPSYNFAHHQPPITINNPQYHLATQNPGHILNYSNDSFIVQVKNGPRAQSARSFLRAGDEVNLKSYSATDASLSLRISQNHNIAVQDADLTSIQPKVFYATPEIVAESNLRLHLLEANVRLYMVDNQRTITIGAKTLRRVMPINQSNNTRGLAFRSTQNCDNMVQQVMGIGSGFLVPKDVPSNVGLVLWEYEIARDINVIFGDPLTNIDNSGDVARATSMRTIATLYAGHVVANPTHMNFSNFRVNKYAQPEVGEGFVISTLIATPVDGGGVVVAGVAATAGKSVEDHTLVGVGGGPPQLVDGRLTWGSHWGGVVARDGDDVVTLENYARTQENIPGGLAGDTQFYFQMYNRALVAPLAQTWHGTWGTSPMIAYGGGPTGLPVPPAGGWAPFPVPTHRPASPGARSVPNAITTAVRIPDTQWTTLARNRYNGQVENIKNDYNLVATSTSAHLEIKEVLKGLYYADYYLPRPRGANRAIVTAWKDALRNPTVADRYPENKHAIAYTLAQLDRL